MERRAFSPASFRDLFETGRKAQMTGQFPHGQSATGHWKLNYGA
jgi:hypothetical protein